MFVVFVGLAMYPVGLRLTGLARRTLERAHPQVRTGGMP
jgi:hypothetical protein